MDLNSSARLQRARALVLAAITTASCFCGRGVSCVFSQELTLPEPAVKAAFLYNFAKLTYWPTNAFASGKASLVIGILGKDPLGSVLDEMVKNKRIESRSVEVRRFERATEVRDCQVLYISDSERERIPLVLASLRGRSILTVADTKEFTARGGMIQLVKLNEAIRFQVNTNATARAGLRLNSTVLRLAIALQSGGGEGEN